MSHYSVLVIGPNVDDQLAPFHEFECTGMEAYIQEIDKTQEILDALEEARKENPEKSYAELLDEAMDDEGLSGAAVVEYEEDVDITGPHKYHYAIVKDGKLVKAVRRTNPDKKWDWYKVGGRFNGFFKLKPGRQGIVGDPGLQRIIPNYRPPENDRADVCLKGDIDVDGMREDEALEAAQRYDVFEEITRDLPPITTWKEMLKKHGEDHISEAREEYRNQPAIVALQNDERTRSIWNVDPYVVGRERYVADFRDNAGTIFAVIKDGQWYEKGEMGWWGIVLDEKENDKWLEEYSRLFDSLPDNTLLSVVDCHI